ncbi:MAG: DUF4340 domain-containing protein [Candidatus Sericytochromatia bacterium]
MNFRTTLVLIFVLLALIGSYFYLDNVKKNNERLENKTKKLLNIPLDKIKSYSYKNNLEKFNVKLVNRTDNWFVEEPIISKANFDAIFNQLDPLINAKYLNKIEKYKNLSDFGLDKPSMVFEFKTEDGDTTVSFGSKSPTGQEVYVMKNKEPVVYLFDANLFFSSMRKYYELRNKNLLDFQREDVTEISIKNKNGLFVIRKDENKWNLVHPKKAQLKEKIAIEFLDKIQLEMATDFVEDHPKDLKKYGLEDPQVICTIVTNKTNISEFYFGNEIGDYTYGKNNKLDSVMKVSKYISEKYNFNLKDLE